MCTPMASWCVLLWTLLLVSYTHLRCIPNLVLDLTTNATNNTLSIMQLTVKGPCARLHAYVDLSRCSCHLKLSPVPASNSGWTSIGSLLAELCQLSKYAQEVCPSVFIARIFTVLSLAVFTMLHLVLPLQSQWRIVLLNRFPISFSKSHLNDVNASRHTSTFNIQLTSHGVGSYRFLSVIPWPVCPYFAAFGHLVPSFSLTRSLYKSSDSSKFCGYGAMTPSNAAHGAMNDPDSDLPSWLCWTMVLFLVNTYYLWTGAATFCRDIMMSCVVIRFLWHLSAGFLR